VDIAQPLAEMLRAFAEGKDGYLFSTRSGRPLGHRNVNRAAGVGVHALRRFRIETLRRARVPEDLIGLWLGHAPRTITDLYAEGLKLDRDWRREWCEKAGLGFSWSGLYGAIKQVPIMLEKAA
jgi:integrase